MKRLLSLLSAMAVGCSSATSVVACGSDADASKHLNSQGNSIWAWLPGIKEGQKPDSGDVWREMSPFEGGQKNPADPATWDSDTKAKASIQILKMLDVAILANAKQVFSQPANQSFTQIADYSNLANRLTTDWTNLKDSVNNEVQKNKISYQNQYGKDWESKWNDMLKDKYDSNINNYKAYLYTSSTVDNATTELTNTLLNNTANTYNQTAPSVLRSNMQAFIASKQTADDYFKTAEQKELAREIVLSFTDYMTTNAGVTPIWAKDNAGTLDWATVKTGMTTAQTNFENTSYQNTAVPTKTYNATTDKYTGASINQYAHTQGLYSQFQRFALQKWYKIEKPLAISDITVKYAKTPQSTVTDLTEGLNENLFDTGSKAVISHILTQLNTNDFTWDQFHNDAAIPSGDLVYEKNLLTVNPGSGDQTYTPAFTASVYGALPQLTGTDTPANNPTSLQGLIPLINRTQGATLSNTSIADRQKGAIDNGNMFTTMYVGANAGSQTANNDKIVVFADDTGLHFVHVDGLEAFLTTPAKAGNDQQLANPQQTLEDYNNFTYNVTKNKNTLGDSAAKDIGTVANDRPDAFNTTIYNNYLQYLTNQSYINSLPNTKSYRSFNVDTALDAFATLDSSSSFGNHLWYSWIYDFFSNYFTNPNILSRPQNNWLNNFINFYSADDATPQSDPSWFTQTLANMNSSLNLYPYTSFVTNIAKNNKTIEGKPTTTNNYPPGEFWNQNVSDEINTIFQVELNPTFDHALWGGGQ